MNKKGISLDKFRVILNFALYLVKLTPELDHDFEKLLDKQYNLNAKDMTGKQKVFEHNKKLIDIMTSAFYGEAASGLIEKTKEAEREMQKAEQRAVREQQEKYKILKASVLQFSEKMNLSPAQIAEVLEVDLTQVLSILKDYKI